MGWPFGCYAACCLLVGVIVLTAADARPTDASVGADSLAILARDILDDTYQQQLPGEEDLSTQTVIDVPEWLANILSSVSRFLLWVFVTVALVLVAVWLAQRVPGHGTDESAAGPGEGGDLLPNHIDLSDVERLAGLGRYGEALHTLLLYVISRLRAGMEASLADSLTSREILSRVGLSDDSRAAMRDLVFAVERSHFGDGEVQGEDYERCIGASRMVLAELKGNGR